MRLIISSLIESRTPLIISGPADESLLKKYNIAIVSFDSLKEEPSQIETSKKQKSKG